MLNVGSDQEHGAYPKPGLDMQMHEDPASELANMIMALGKGRGKEKPSKASMQCYNCGRFGHMARDRSKPKEGNKKGDKGGGGKPQQRLCYNCGKPGHLARDSKAPRGRKRAKWFGRVWTLPRRRERREKPQWLLGRKRVEVIHAKIQRSGERHRTTIK